MSIRDPRARGTATGSYTVTVPAHGTAFLKLRGETAVPGTDLGGKTSASPALIRWDDRTMAVFARDRSGRLHQRSMVDGEWRGWVTLGGPRGGQPSAFASQDGRIDLFVRGPGNVAYHRTYSNGRWGGWRSLGGVISGSPTASANGDRVNVFVRGSDYTLWQQDLVDGAGTWWSQRDQFASNALTGAVGAAAGTGGTAWVAVRGPDNAVHVSTLSGS